MATIAEFLASYTMWLTVLIIGSLGEVAKSLILTKPFEKSDGGYIGWRGVYFVTYKVHGIPVGMLAGLLALATGLYIGSDKSLGAYLLWGGGCGILAMTCYTVLMGTLKSLLTQVGKR